MKKLQNWIKRLWFNWAYLNDPPWDSRVSPPELASFTQNNPAGTALDLGCGTATNVIFLAQNGWQVDGVDFSFLAIQIARRRLKKQKMKANLQVGDVSQLEKLPLRPPFDLVLDIGCLHALGSESAARGYAAGMIPLMRPGGDYLLYAHQPDDPGEGYPPHGLTLEWVQELFIPSLQMKDYQPGKENKRTSAWYFLRKG